MDNEETMKLRFTSAWFWDYYKSLDRKMVESQIRQDVGGRLKKWIKAHSDEDNLLTVTFEIISVYDIFGVRPQPLITIKQRLQACVVNNELLTLKLLENKD